MCGTGRISLPLLQSGISLTCVDSSPEMLSRLRQKLSRSGLSAEVVEQDVTRLTLRGPYTLAFIPFNSFSEITGSADQLSTLASIHQCLAGKGRLIVTLHNPNIRLRKIDGLPYNVGRFPLDKEGSYLTLQAREQYDPATGLVTGQQTFEAFNREEQILWKRMVDIRFQPVSQQEFHHLSRQAAFTVESVFGDYDRSSFVETASPFMIWCLRK
jgi:SAM-dependent methyltransferase